MTRHQRIQRPSVENVRAVFDRDQAGYLLETLCVKLGFCLPPNERERIVSDPPSTVYDFATAALKAEGLDPETEKTLLNGVRMAVAAAFAKSLQPVEDET